VQGVLQDALHGAEPRLLRPAEEPGAVVRQVQTYAHAPRDSAEPAPPRRGNGLVGQCSAYFDSSSAGASVAAAASASAWASCC
jgi:hypothetical protein